jgi:hypothetical protein
MSIIVIGGFGSSSKYNYEFCKYLQYYSQYPVININLVHGCSYKKEMNNITKQIKSNYNNILIGFSTGCTMVLKLAQIIHVKQIILCNPAELLTRLSYNFMKSITNYKCIEHIDRYKILMKKSIIPAWVFDIIICIISVIWDILIFISSKLCAYIYYNLYGYYIGEPNIDELQRIIFSIRFNKLKLTIVECLIKHNVNDIIKNTNIRINIIVGKEDYYIKFSEHLYNNFENNIRIKKIDGCHHMLYHKSKQCANIINNLIY